MPEDLAPGTPAEVVERAKAGPRVPALRRGARPRGHGRRSPCAQAPARRHRRLADARLPERRDLQHRARLRRRSSRTSSAGSNGFRFPRYGGPGGLPVNIEYMLRDLERALRRGGRPCGSCRAALLRGAAVMDEIEDYWERGAGTRPPRSRPSIKHDLAVFGWDLRDALVRRPPSAAERGDQDAERRLLRPDRRELPPSARRCTSIRAPTTRRGG